MFSGQGSQYYQMGRELLDRDETFKRQMESLDQTAVSLLGTSVMEQLYASSRGIGDAFSDPPESNAALLMVEYALTATLRERGIHPDLVLGASLGTFSAACVADSIAPEDAVRLVIEQGQAVAQGVPVGGMVAVLADPALQKDDAILHDHATLAGINAPEHFVLATEQNDLDRVTQRLGELGVTYQVLNAARPFHTAAMDPVEADCQAILRRYAFTTPQIPIVCCSLQLPVRALGPAILWQAVRKPIEFATTIQQLERLGPHRYIDAGPAGSLAAMLNNSDQLTEGSSVASTLSPFGRAQERLDEIATAA
jgi:acyl transferase domain-containing protein